MGITFLTIIHFLLVNCGVPEQPSNGSVGYYPHTREDAIITYWCIDGFRPSAIMTARCSSNGQWQPVPSHHVCTFVTGIHLYCY